MKKEIKEKWVAALRSGEYKQGKARLKKTDETYCCLGVLCDLYLKEKGMQWEPSEAADVFVCEGATAALPYTVQDWSGYIGHSFGAIKSKLGADTDLSILNDSFGYSFEEIADLIEAQL